VSTGRPGLLVLRLIAAWMLLLQCIVNLNLKAHRRTLLKTVTSSWISASCTCQLRASKDSKHRSHFELESPELEAGARMS